MSDYNSIPDVPMDVALDNSGGNQTSVTSITSRSIDMRSGAIVVSSPNGKVAQLGVQPDNAYNLKFLDPRTGIGIAQFGNFSDGSTAIKVAKAGQEVSTATNDQLIFNSNQDVFKIVGSGTLTIPLTTIGSSNTASAAHSLGFAPAHISFIDLATQYAMPYTGLTGAGAVSFQVITFTNAVNVGATLTVTSASGANIGPLNVKYYFLQETAS